MHDQSQKAKEFKALLVRLSGRQTKRKQPITAPALLAGYLILLSAYELLQVMTPEEITEAVAKIHHYKSATPQHHYLY